MARTRKNGTDGDDVLDIKFGFNDVFGLKGKDTIRLLSEGDTAGNNFVDAGSGRDSVVNHFEGSNQIILGSGNDIYIGLGFGLGGTKDIVEAGTGDDQIFVQTLHSDYLGQDGDDLFVSVGFKNRFDGGDGIDTISYQARSDDSTSVGRTGVEIRLDLPQQQTFTGTQSVELLFNIENARGSNNSDTIAGSGGANVLEGLDGNDLIIAGGGKDVLKGGEGNDELQGGTNTDELFGENGNDKLFGESSSDTLDGGGGDDQLDGGSSADLLKGGSGADTLFGGSGNDTLRGGKNKDTLIGGTGDDIFDFNSIEEASSLPQSSRRDIITDFTRGDDVIDLRSIDANTTTDGNQNFRLRDGEHSSFTGTKGQLIWDKQGSGDTAKTVISGDTDGDRDADFQIELTGRMSLSEADFVL